MSSTSEKSSEKVSGTERERAAEEKGHEAMAEGRGLGD
jgi:hypothetical protein